MLSEPPCSRTGLSACILIAIRSRIADNVPIYPLRKFFKGAAKLWVPADTQWWMFVKACASHTTRMPTKKGIWGKCQFMKKYISGLEKSWKCPIYVVGSFEWVLKLCLRKKSRSKNKSHINRHYVCFWEKDFQILGNCIQYSCNVVFFKPIFELHCAEVDSEGLFSHFSVQSSNFLLFIFLYFIYIYL